MPSAPLTLEGYCVLHQMFRVRWRDWKQLPARERADTAAEAARVLQAMEAANDGASAVFALVGSKGDLMLVHFRRSVEELKRAELALQQLRLADYLRATASFLSMIELGLYESSVKLFGELARRGVEQYSPEWNAEASELLERQRAAMAPRLYPEMPADRYVCFYPMSRRRGEQQNFYTAAIADRSRMMREHGMTGRRHAADVRQIITGAMGLDNWEWGVTLWSNDALAFKKLVYEMRFDEASAIYAEFGPFYVGVRAAAASLPDLLDGRLP